MTRFALALASLVLVCGPSLAAVTGSSEYKNRRSNADWSAGSAADSDLDTAWMNGDGSDGTGSWLRLDLPRGVFTGLRIATGAQNRGKYSRPKEISFAVYTNVPGETATDPLAQGSASLEDKEGYQEVKLNEPVDLTPSLYGGSVTLTIQSVYTGEDFEECAIAEIITTYKEVKAPTTLSEVSSGKGDRLVDENTKVAWVADGTEGETVSVEAAGWIASSIGIIPGNASAWSSYARVKDAELSIGGQTWTYTFKDTKAMQWVPLPTVAGVAAWPYGTVTIKVLSVYPGKRAQVSISEAQIRALAFDG